MHEKTSGNKENTTKETDFGKENRLWIFVASGHVMVLPFSLHDRNQGAREGKVVEKQESSLLLINISVGNLENNVVR